jgi:hypothetical protein
MSGGTITYLMGRSAVLFDLPECSKNHWRWYESNWRILHVDGFEPGYGSRTIQFCWSTGVHPGRFADKIPSENV